MDGPAGYTNVNYWDDVAQDYDGEIMSSFDEDLKRIIHKRVCEHCQGPVSSFALDLGCGVGKYLPLLATRCSKVLGVDISNELLTQAQRLCDPFSNVKLRCVDLGNYVLDAHTTGDLPLHQATFLVCANVIISPDQTVCSKIFDTVTKCLAPGGKLLLVIPSQESAHLATSLIDDWRDAQRRRASSGRGAKGRKLKLEESEVSSEESGGLPFFRYMDFKCRIQAILSPPILISAHPLHLFGLAAVIEGYDPQKCVHNMLFG